MVVFLKLDPLPYLRDKNPPSDNSKYAKQRKPVEQIELQELLSAVSQYNIDVFPNRFFALSVGSQTSCNSTITLI